MLPAVLLLLLLLSLYAKKCAPLLVPQLSFVIRRDCKASQIRIITPDFDLFAENVKKEYYNKNSKANAQLVHVPSFGYTWLSLVAGKF